VKIGNIWRKYKVQSTTFWLKPPKPRRRENRKNRIMKYEQDKVLANKRKQLRRIRCRWRKQKQKKVKNVYSRKC
jgi:hypothetical protein